ncbi:zinc ribbon domain-containing protein [Natronolimnobius sp. AArcel1]|uniref:zinc ribbon domain-containing protein n=1 Tax=Natronolimnobius sp. AArcel1 TaxID=1679093 RepID=UPI0013ED6984|nr:zinc ribbon domain-containing protein [Natronolimnobius sp. AArcel1]NGM69707.1 zinc ribbon domain-containing protein [Natronolimnobius sp. AArcel1]
MSWFRALLAGGLSVILPGAGHAVLRDWIRALIFVGLYLSAIALFFPVEMIANADSVTEGAELATQETETMGQFVLSFIVLFAAIDATFRSLGFPPNSSSADVDGPTCPECGKELDDDLEFCHWCTTRLEPRGDDEDDEDESESESENDPERAEAEPKEA